MNLKQQAVNGVFWSAIESLGRQGISAAIYFLLARLLGPESYGLVSLAWVYLSFIYLFIDQGFSNAIVQRPILDPEHLDTAFWTQVGVGVALTGLSFVTADGVAQFFHQPRLTPIIQSLAASFVLVSLMNVQQAILRRQFEFRLLAVRSLLAVAIAGAVGIGMALSGYGAWSLVGQHLTNIGVQTVILWSVARWRPRLRFSRSHFDELWKFGLPLVGLELLNFANTRLDDLLIGYFLGPTALGYYTLAYRLLTVTVELITSVATRVAMSVFSRLQEDLERLRQAFYRSTRLTATVSFPVFLGLVALAPMLIPTFFGMQWQPSVPVMQALAFVGLLHSVFYFNGTTIVAIGKPQWQLILTAITAIANGIAFTITVRWGIVAVAIAYAVRAYLLIPLELWLVCKFVQINLKIYFGQYLGTFASAVLAALSIFGVQYLIPMGNLKFALIPSVLLGAGLYIVLLRFLAPKRFAEAWQLVRRNEA
jgi:PST family polysaccharide transporter